MQADAGTQVKPYAAAAVAVGDFDPRSRAEVPGQSTHFPRKSHTMPPICWGAADTEGSGSGGALPPGRGVGRWTEGGGLVLGEGLQQKESCVENGLGRPGWEDR